MLVQSHFTSSLPLTICTLPSMLNTTLPTLLLIDRCHSDQYSISTKIPHAEILLPFRNHWKSWSRNHTNLNIWKYFSLSYWKSKVLICDQRSYTDCFSTIYNRLGLKSVTQRRRQTQQFQTNQLQTVATVENSN